MNDNSFKLQPPSLLLNLLLLCTHSYRDLQHTDLHGRIGSFAPDVSDSLVGDRGLMLPRLDESATRHANLSLFSQAHPCFPKPIPVFPRIAGCRRSISSGWSFICGSLIWINSPASEEQTVPVTP